MTKCLFLLSILALPVPISAQSLDTAVSEMASEIKRSTATKIAILEFSYTDMKDSQGPAIIQERITTALVKRHLGIIVERKLLDRVMGELKLQRAGAIDPATIKRTKAYMDARLADLRGDAGRKIKPTEGGDIVLNDSVTVNTEVFSDAVMKTILNGVRESGLEQPMMENPEEDTGNP